MCMSTTLFSIAHNMLKAIFHFCKIQHNYKWVLILHTPKSFEPFTIFNNKCSIEPASVYGFKHFQKCNLYNANAKRVLWEESALTGEYVQKPKDHTRLCLHISMDHQSDVRALKIMQPVYISLYVSVLSTFMTEHFPPVVLRTHASKDNEALYFFLTTSIHHVKQHLFFYNGDQWTSTWLYGSSHSVISVFYHTLLVSPLCWIAWTPLMDYLYA